MGARAAVGTAASKDGDQKSRLMVSSFLECGKPNNKPPSSFTRWLKYIDIVMRLIISDNIENSNHDNNNSNMNSKHNI